jgi:hypothetical protein
MNLTSGHVILKIFANIELVISEIPAHWLILVSPSWRSMHCNLYLEEGHVIINHDYYPCRRADTQL